jgi:hypothetical protein
MAKTPSPLHSRRVPKTVSPPTETAAAAATAAESAVVPAAKRAARKVRPAAPVAAPEVAVRPAKSHKPKLVRDSFTIPKDEYQVLDTLKGRALGLERHVKKGELIRAGIRALDAMSDRAFLNAVDAVPTLKTGRPKKA